MYYAKVKQRLPDKKEINLFSTGKLFCLNLFNNAKTPFSIKTREILKNLLKLTILF
jgi:hypothetical protein